MHTRIANQAAWERASKIGNSRKCLGEDAKGRLDPASEKPLALAQNGVAPVKKRFRRVQETLGRPWLSGSTKRPCAPFRNHFKGNSLFSIESQTLSSIILGGFFARFWKICWWVSVGFFGGFQWGCLSPFGSL